MLAPTYCISPRYQHQSCFFRDILVVNINPRPKQSSFFVLAGRWLGRPEFPDCAVLQRAAAETCGPFCPPSWAVWAMPVHVWFREQPEMWPWCHSWDPPVPFVGAVIAPKSLLWFLKPVRGQASLKGLVFTEVTEASLGRKVINMEISVKAVHFLLPVCLLLTSFCLLFLCIQVCVCVCVCVVCKCTFYSVLIIAFCGKVGLMWGLPPIPEAQLVFRQLKLLSANCV